MPGVEPEGAKQRRRDETGEARYGTRERHLTRQRHRYPESSGKKPVRRREDKQPKIKKEEKKNQRWVSPGRKNAGCSGTPESWFSKWSRWRAEEKESGVVDSQAHEAAFEDTPKGLRAQACSRREGERAVITFESAVTSPP
ncbi:hypothetical protein SKAU_G00351610 [Synaphobranchus kaupii]|uniref:Uncharacterized protein n=1 Tax=Synaphobranchus kaupii TaxID=118154 RepID=A0A9Q1IG27_SYNKA|nr:hypothetical protein SKAU_G00351610 [Synaphobranchus kaupii]